MKVAYDSRPITDPPEVGRHSRSLLRALRETAGAGEEVTETHRPRGADVFHAPRMDSALLHSPVPMVVTLSDLTSLKRRSEYLRSGVRVRLRHLAVQRAMRVIVPTESVARDARERLGLEPERIAVIHEAAGEAMYHRPEAEIELARARFELPRDYLLWVGGLRRPDPGNHLAKLAATTREMPLVLVGPAGQWAHELPNVILTGEVSDDELAAIYSGAHALVVPSQHEGFALPAVEALACRTPVVACEAAGLREALSGRVTFVEPCDMAALVRAGEAATRPVPAAAPWTWLDAARLTWSVYREAVAAVDGPRTAGRTLRLRPSGGMGSTLSRPH